MIDPVLNPEKGYNLQLANGQKWHIMSTEEVRPWADKLASIMELRTGDPDGYPRLVFIRRESNKEGRGWPTGSLDLSLMEDLPSSGWAAQDLRAVTLWSHPDVPDVICELGHKEDRDLGIVRMCLALHPIYQRAQSLGGLPFHAALAQRNGDGVLLAAPGNSGKSTCCRRLPPPWQALCDDETLVVREKRKGYLAHPFPTWSDYLRGGSERTWNVQQHFPLSAIFFLEPAETNEVVPIGRGQAVVRINQSATEACRIYWRNLNREEEISVKKKVFYNACDLAEAVAAFKLRVSLTGRFWEEIEKVL